MTSFLVIVGSRATAADDVGPEHADAGPGYAALMDRAGFTDITIIDVTEEYIATLESWTTVWEAETIELTRLLGAAEFADRQARRLRATEAARERRLARLWVTARRPDPG